MVPQYHYHTYLYLNKTNPDGTQFIHNIHLNL